MRLENHIATLLYRYQCVVVPGFGAFLSQIKPAYLQKDSNTFYPPYKELSFNAQLNKNDGLLVSHIAQSENSPYETILEKVEAIAKGWNNELQDAGTLEFPQLGVFRLNTEKKILFEPADRTNYLLSSFGLSPVMGSPVTREILKEEVEELEEHIPFTITPETRQSSGLRPWMKYAAVVFLALATGLSGYSLYQKGIETTSVAHAAAQEEVSRNIQEATFFNTNPVELPSVTLEVFHEEKEENIHHIVAGAYRIRENADKRVRQLISRGYPAHYLGENSFGLHQVVFASYADPEEALKALKQIRAEESRDAWLLSMR
jgi:hypothetical protein